ncbi:VOC family protein [Rubellicoccus peritrichatus]|uniref:VOC family protein n=1 Tax=Rubellicoccus peritrichatus TaxID=3080537 RepID=A0AAQ3QWG5_9BACT|nr:VOC family protein [Puniceicoccus sp. CR14]WOO41850.1 VOC family protein [Puniceicoccus sp. CR14]
MMKTDTKITALAHICLRTNDFDATQRFYSDTLGFPIKFCFTRNGDLAGFYLEIADRQFIEFFYNDDPQPPAENAAFAHFCLETSDIEATRAKLAEAGYEPTEIKMGCDQSLQFWVADPNGVRFEFHQYTSESMQFAGGSVEIDW